MQHCVKRNVRRAETRLLRSVATDSAEWKAISYGVAEPAERREAMPRHPPKRVQYQQMKYALILVSVLLSACANTPQQTPSTEGARDGAMMVSANGKYASESNIATTADGRIFVVWSERDADKKFDIFVNEFDSNLNAKGPAVRVNPQPSTARTWYGDAPSILIAPDGKIYVAWNRIYPDKQPGNDLVLSTSTDGGKTFGEPLKINDDTAPASHGMHGMTLDSRGRVLISWLDERYLKKTQARRSADAGPMLAMFFHHTPTPAAPEPQSEEPDAELYFATVVDGKLEGPNRKIGAQICPCCRVAVTAAADGSVYVAFRKVWPGQMRHISLVGSKDGGATFSEPVQVSDDKWKLYACPVSGAAMRVSAKSELEVVWFSGGERAEKGVYRTTSTDRGATFAAPTLVSKTMIKGTPAFAGDSLIFATPEKIFNSTSGTEKQIADGTAPTTAITGGNAYVSYSKLYNDQPSIWLSRVK